MIVNFISRIGASIVFAFTITLGLLTHKIKWSLLIQQMYRFGVGSLSIIALSSIFIGSILTYQSYYALKPFGSIETLGQLIAMSVHRELGPVICALLLAGRAASSCTAELMLMRETDQMDALRVLGANIDHWIIYPRLLGYWLSSIFLSIIFHFGALLTSGFLACFTFSLEWHAYWARMSQAIKFEPDIKMWMIKTAFFAWIVAVVMIRQGIMVKPSNEGIALAVTKTVVISSLLILFSDTIITFLTL